MSFTSINFIVFIVVVVVMNYIIPRTKRWLFLLAASYYFYLNWQPIYGLLLLGTSVITYLSALLMGDEGKPKRLCSRMCAPIGLTWIIQVLQFHHIVNTWRIIKFRCLN